jgi:hypothetical protein
MKIKLEESFLRYRETHPFDSITVTAATSGGSCCRIVVPKVRPGMPEGAQENYHIEEANGITFFISKNLELEPTLIFSHQRMLGRDLLEMRGFVIRHASQV